MHIKRRGVSAPAAFSISAVTPSAPPAFQLFIALLAAFTYNMLLRWIYTEILVLYRRVESKLPVRAWPI